MEPQNKIGTLKDKPKRASMTIQQLIEKKRSYVETKIDKVENAIYALASTLEGEDFTQFINEEAKASLEKSIKLIQGVIDQRAKYAANL